MLKPRVAVALALSIFLMPCLCFAMDDDYVPDDADAVSDVDDADAVKESGQAQPADTGSAPQEKKEQTIKIALFNVRQTIDAEKRTSRDMVALIHKQLKEALSAINVKPAEIIEHDAIMSNLNRRQQFTYNKCWVDQNCLAGLLEGSGANIMVAGKLSAQVVQTSAQAGSNLVELTLLVKIVDLKDQRILKEFLIIESDETRLAEKSYERMYYELEKLGLIIDRSKMGEDPNATRTNDIVFVTPQVVEERTTAMQIAKWTTLGTGLLSVGLGGVFTGLAAKAADDQKNVSSLDGLKSNRDKRDNYMLASYILYGVGGGLLISSVVLFVLDSPQGGSGDADAWSGASVTPTEGGAFVSTGFSF